MHGSPLSVIVTRDFFRSAEGFIAAAGQIADAGAGFIQIRDKSCDKRKMLQEARRVKERLKARRAILVVNDHVDIAALIRADGVHLGQRDLPIEAARSILGREAIIGISCANLTQALAAQKAGADYIGIGPVFPTPTKTDEPAVGLGVLAELTRHLRIPFYAIGGINGRTIQKVLQSGAERVAVSSAICLAKDRKRATRFFNRILRRS